MAGTDLCRRPVVGRVVEGCADGRLVGQAGVLALDGVRVLVGVAAVVVAPSVPGAEGGATQSERKPWGRSHGVSAGSLPMLLSVCVHRHPVGGGGGGGRGAVPHAGKLLAGLWGGAACCRHCVCKGPRIRLNSAW